MLGFDHDSYRIYYQRILLPVINEYCAKESGIEVRPNAEELVWGNYVKLNRHCREEYMNNPEKLADRHKITACYIYAILKADILHCSLSKELGDDMNLLLNERLALCFGMTLLRALIRGNAKELKDEEMKEKVLNAFEDEMFFPKTNHGDYKQNLLFQLYYTKKEGNYNILALADSMFFIENHNLIINDIPEDVFKKQEISA